MNDDREVILSRVRGALAQLAKRAAYPAYPDDVAVMREITDWRDPWGVFCERTKLVNGTGLERPEDLVALLKSGQWLHGYCDPKLWPQLAPAFGPEFTVELEFDRTRVDDYQFGITRAVGAIAETGTLILSDTTTSRRLGALAPWVHIALLRREEVLTNVAQAVALLGDDPNIIWVTGPSKTADVEGILIEGVHGPGRQIALLMG
jgi:L-lactate dehydrogenase complex protein LldG